MQKSPARKAVPMILLVIPFLYLTFATPFGEPAQTILEVSYICILLGITVWESLRFSGKVDEVQIAAGRFSASIGAYTGLACTAGLVIVMTRVPAVAQFIAHLSDTPKNNLPPAAAGFGLGAMAAIFFVFICGIIAYAAWFWRSTRH